MPKPRPLTPELVDLHERLRSEGVAIDVACRVAGHSVRAWYDWKTKADEGENGVYAEFAKRVLPKSKQRGEIVVADPKDWQRIDYFQEWASGLILDSGEPWEPEEWQLAWVEDVLSWEFQVVWLIVPEANGKTTLTGAVDLYLLEHQLTPEIPIGSATTTQAETLFRQIEGFVLRSGKLKDFNLAPGIRRIDCRKTGGHARVYPHNERSGDGVIPSAWNLDEGHLHPDMRLYRLWKGKYRKRKGVGMGISTSGEPASEFEDLRERWVTEAGQIERDGPFIRAIHGSTCLHDYAVRDRDKVEDFEEVAKANPLSLIVASELAEKYAEPEMTHAHWLRRTCNIASRESGQAIVAEVWDALLEEGLQADAGSTKYGFIDLGWEIDTTAMGILAWENEFRRLIVGVKILEPPVDEADVVKGLAYLQQEFAPKVWVVDPNASGKNMVQQLDKGTHPDQGNVRFDFAYHTQDNAPMCLAAVRFDEAVRNGWIRHDGHPGLRKHVLSAVKKTTFAEKWRYARPQEAVGRARAKFPTDALIGAVMAHSVAVEAQEQGSRTVVVY